MGECKRYREGGKIGQPEQEKPEEQPKSLNDIFDNFIKETNDIFFQLEIAYQVIAWKGFEGEDTLDQFNDSLAYTPPDFEGFKFTQMTIGNIKVFKKCYPYFLMEMFHGKLVQAWNNCLDDIFIYFINAHFSKNRAFKELGAKHLVKLDFNILELQEFISKLQENARLGFKLTEYKDRINYIKKAVDSNVDDKYFKDIHKHVLIRNVIQHSNSILKENFIDKLGNKKLFNVLDTNGRSFSCKADEKITLSFFEIKSFINKMQFVVKKWKEAEGEK